MLDRSRVTLLTWSLGCLLLCGLLGWGITAGWAPLVTIDDTGENLSYWAEDQAWLTPILRIVEVCFGFVGSTIITLIVAAFMWWKSYRRAAYFTVMVMLLSTVLNRVLKWVVDRDRPEWQALEHFHATPSYPSGHATAIAALGGIAVVLAIMLVRRPVLRRLIHAGVVLIGLAVGLDRVLLGRHYPLDVLGGYLLGAGVVLLCLVLFSPQPERYTVRPQAVVLPEPEPEAGRRLGVVLNPIKVEDVGQFRHIVGGMAREAGWSEPSWYYTTVEDPGTGMAEQAAVDGADLVIVCGGDGTVREVCAELAGTGIPVGIIPAGTGNLLARNLEIPLYIRAAIDVALNGQDRAIDMVEVEGDDTEPAHFLVMAGMGFDAAIMDGVNEDIKKRVGWLAYVLSGTKALMFPAVRLEISMDDGPFTKHRARTVVVGNVGTLTAGMPLIPDAEIDDGQLDVVLLYPQRFLSWVPLAWRILSRRPHTDDLVNRMTGQKVVIRADRDTPRQLDGDSIGPGRELTMTTIHGRLLVRVPQ
ncbi:diacylglycerol kinase family protein [Nocardioides insulae]|uniref:diacylglycerol kinase family protein n=1 Tax=Nocardioides insulae TaxID=394734 RepID=UPI0004258985|nr:diacylglycerol kinase family protein [Nocardioides insulae]